MKIDFTGYFRVCVCVGCVCMCVCVCVYCADFTLSISNVVVGPASVAPIMIVRWPSVKTTRKLKKKLRFITDKTWKLHSTPGAIQQGQEYRERKSTGA